MEILIAIIIIGTAMSISEASNHGHLDSLPLQWFREESWGNKYEWGGVYRRKYIWYKEMGTRLTSYLGLFYGMCVYLGLWSRTPLVAFTDAFHFFKTIWMAGFCYIISVITGHAMAGVGIYILIAFTFEMVYGQLIPFIIKKWF